MVAMVSRSITPRMKTLVDLVRHYHENTLRVHNPELDTTLKFPLGSFCGEELLEILVVPCNLGPGEGGLGGVTRKVPCSLKAIS